MEDYKRYWIGFNLIKGIGAVRFRRLLEAFGDLEAAWQADLVALEQAGLGRRIAEAVIAVREGDQLLRLCEQIEALGVTVLTWEDAAYPRRLKEIDQPPPVLYLRGELRAEDMWAVAIVGTRKATAYGRQVAAELAGGLARQGVTVVSGLATGCDTVAHQAALQAGGRTLAVLGTGVDQIYPPQNRALAERILTAGALISDYPLGTQPEGSNFPPRNRIISGLSQAVIVVEASEQSGALITAAFAAEQGRPVFAVPGQMYAPQSKGTNRLVKEGARILTDLQDVLEVLNLAQLQQQRQAQRVLPADPLEASLYDLLKAEPQHVDELGRLADLPIAQVSATLTLMELKGLARHVGGMRYVAVFEPSTPYQTAAQQVEAQATSDWEEAEEIKP